MMENVVNCFQNGIFPWKSQPSQSESNALDSCELLSKWYFPVEITAGRGCYSFGWGL